MQLSNMWLKNTMQNFIYGALTAELASDLAVPLCLLLSVFKDDSVSSIS